MAWRSSTLDPLEVAPGLEISSRNIAGLSEARNPLSGPPAMEIFHSVATGQAPLAEGGTSEDAMEYNSMQNWKGVPPCDNPFLQYSQYLPVTAHGLREVGVQGYGEQEPHSEKSEACTTSKYDYEQSGGTSFLGSDGQREVLSYPEGDADTVTIYERDMESLRPTQYLGNNIIDFYIRYLESRLSRDQRGRIHFFSSFFFTDLLESNSASYSVDQFKAGYEHVRKWSRKANLFEKDYVFIPVIRSSHWSLIIICHLRSLWSASDEKKESPCILHLDSIEGKHENFGRLVRSYIAKAWMEKYAAAYDREQLSDHLSDLFQMEYVQAEVPRQDNGYDCGLYLLRYIKVFLHQSTSLSFSPAPRKGVPLFSSLHFAQDISVKRLAIWNLILGLKDAQGNYPPMFDAQRHVSKQSSIGALAVMNNPEQRLTETHETVNRTSCELTLDTKALNDVAFWREECPSIEEFPMDKNQQVRKCRSAALPGPSKVSKKRKWTDEETRTLLNCKSERGRFFRDDRTGMNWDNVSHEISKNSVGTAPSAEQCRRRYETLQKAYKSLKGYSAETGRSFSEITDGEKVGLKLATTLNEEWYTCIDAFSHKVKTYKQARDSGGDGTGQVSAGDLNHSAPVGSPVPAPAAMTAPVLAPVAVPTGNSSRKQIAIPGFKGLEEDLRSTLLDLMLFLRIDEESLYVFEDTCRRVGIVQDRNPNDIRKHVFQLSALKLVNFEYDDDDGTVGLNVWDLRVYEKFVEKVLRKNPDFDICLHLQANNGMVSIPEASVSLSVHRIRVLVLHQCEKLKCLDLSFFPELRYLKIGYCHKLEKVTGWEAVKDLGYLQITWCDSYKDFPPVQRLPSLTEFMVHGYGIEISSAPDFSQCVRLRKLNIEGNKPSALNSMDLSTLRFLEALDLRGCDALTTIQGLSALHSLTTLDLEECEALRRVPELGCLKALTRLDMSFSGVEEISGVQELHLLTSLQLAGCHSLTALPYLGHLKALTRLYISWSGVEEIPGVHDLISLEVLMCEGSRLKWLPDMRRLPRLQRACVVHTPLYDESPSLYDNEGWWLDHESLRKRKDFDDDISDISDTDNSD